MKAEEIVYQMLDEVKKPLKLTPAPEPEPDPTNFRSEVDRLLPTKNVRLRGNSMIHAPGIIAAAQNLWSQRSAQDKKRGMDIIKTWQGLPKELYIAILSGKAHIETDGDDAVITIPQY